MENILANISLDRRAIILVGSIPGSLLGWKAWKFKILLDSSNYLSLSAWQGVRALAPGSGQLTGW